jgi:FtsZ-binding cell division protein ZapB
MAFDFLGTLSLEQLRDLRNFLSQEIITIEEEINTLRVELDNLKRTQANFVQVDQSFGGKVLDVLYDTELPDIVKIPRQDDANIALLVEKAKKPIITNIKYKRERIEYKIKKLMDTIEQMNELIDRKAIGKTQSIQLLDRVEASFNDLNKNNLFKTTNDMKNFKKGIVTT